MWLGALAALIVLLAACAPGTAVSGTNPDPREELLAQTREAMAAQEGFRGGPVHSATQVGPAITYADPDRMLLEGLGGDFHPYMLLIGEEVFFSHDGRHWLTSPELGSALAFFRFYYDPRTVLAHARAPEDAGVETIDGDLYRVVTAQLDVEGLLKTLPRPEPRLHLHVRFPYAQETGAEALEALGYEVIVVRRHGSATWELFKDGFHISVYEDLGGPARHEPESGSLSLRARVHGVDTLEPEVEEELGSVLRTFGADPAVLEQANVQIEGEELHSYLRAMLRDVTLRFWIDDETVLLRQVAWEGVPEAGDAVLGFWDYGEHVSLERPEAVMDGWRAGALGSVAAQGWGTLRRAVDAYHGRHGRYPEELTPETVGEVLDDLDLQWPVNPFQDAPMRNAEASPGDFHYISYGDTYHLSVYGWDHAMATRTAEPPPLPAATPTHPD